MLLTRWPRTLAFGAALALLAAACGGDEDAPETDPVAEAEEVEDAAEVEEPADEPDAAEPDAAEPEPEAEPAEAAADADAWCAEAIGIPTMLDPGDFDDEVDQPVDDRMIAELQMGVTTLERMAALAPPEISAENVLVVQFFEIILDVAQTVHQAGGTEDDIDAALWIDERISDDQILALDALMTHALTNC